MGLGDDVWQFVQIHKATGTSFGKRLAAHLSAFNVQARVLAGGRFGTTDATWTNVVGPALSEPAIAAAAKDSLDRAFCVGNTEDFVLPVNELLTRLECVRQSSRYGKIGG